ncbi:helix-turn-helix domain-containing protein [Aeromicrobium chenweiae]|uniref:Helix-turn-helix transcriptional regulator n=1 Tax=Aeromicrobium chenweiae TaxID=2079793 RepID=A0A2S0WJJ0_9ACTN|nr:helix-turn-helix transcriptional regulator [Aeromicrobium chenweiae]AWB91452.1 helix-turn-helix transcriptional regulator [Aeromicrobium chenweiae]TGN30617.1 LuxR family transcriptional regulator [Aeromicrobium chenweiae]
MARVTDLSDEDLDVLRLLSRGHTTDAIARELGVSERTLRRRGRLICDRLGVKTPIEAVVWAVRSRLI